MSKEEEPSDDNGDDSGRDVIRAVYDWTTTRPSVAIVKTLATIEDADPASPSVDENFTLQDYVDPDALNTLLQDDRRNVAAVTFHIGAYTVRITGSGSVVVRTGEQSR